METRLYADGQRLTTEDPLGLITQLNDTFWLFISEVQYCKTPVIVHTEAVDWGTFGPI